MFSIIKMFNIVVVTIVGSVSMVFEIDKYIFLNLPPE